ncbi:hypothetical protein DFH09DRAFT_1175604 [Mycena vulgaris]|nr:hypothetical protein DFH09DRAFT_1175604 [Mycena vulgaris]
MAITLLSIILVANCVAGNARARHLGCQSKRLGWYTCILWLWRYRPVLFTKLLRQQSSSRLGIRFPRDSNRGIRKYFWDFSRQIGP